MARSIYPNAKSLLLEATPKHEPRLQQVCKELANAEHQIAVLADKTGDTVDFFQSGNAGNSMFKENTEHYANAAPTKRTTITLDDAIQQSFLKAEPFLDYIKLDVQGAELKVLQGAAQTLEKASFVQFEASTTEYNSGGACFYEIDQFLRERGFYFYEVADLMRNPAFKTLGLGQFDVLYVKPASPRLPAKYNELNGKYCGMGRSSSSSVRSSSYDDLSPAYLWSLTQQSSVYDEFWSGWLVGMACGIALSLIIIRSMTGKERGEIDFDVMFVVAAVVQV
eukprot:CAMPEP_0178561478 /NCGR_PEP_ID=MMETSP0697-20121206/12025_1 /TAXON_ID=265572 /ORGANISM="Extubocellulus spinifer, Strain CCMP396" /LENGTH=279 /DNA_ID=CAMNT_0020194771 /DNA_START=266 /DNA_END=1103 /DNA_ORIENTATION=-